MKLIQKRRLPEAMVQAEFYIRCREEGIPCILEYKIKGARFDAVIHNYNEITHIVEIKSMVPERKAKRLAKPKELKQFKKYESFGLPVIWIINIEDIDAAIDKIKKTKRMIHVNSCSSAVKN